MNQLGILYCSSLELSRTVPRSSSAVFDEFWREGVQSSTSRIRAETTKHAKINLSGFSDNLTIYMTMIVCAVIFGLILVYAHLKDRQDIKQVRDISASRFSG